MHPLSWPVRQFPLKGMTAVLKIRQIFVMVLVFVFVYVLYLIIIIMHARAGEWGGIHRHVHLVMNENGTAQQLILQNTHCKLNLKK